MDMYSTLCVVLINGLAYTPEFKDNSEGKGKWSKLPPVVKSFFRIKQYYADMTFSLEQGAVPVLIENIVEGNYIRMHADDYLQVLDSLYPTGRSPYDNSSSCALFGIALNLLRTPLNPAKWEVYLLPFLAQQNGIYSDDQRPTLETTITRQSYRISANIISIWTFFALTLSVVISCTILSCYAGYTPIPDTCPFPEFDIASKLGRPGINGEVGLTTFANVSARMVEGKTRDLPKLFGDFTVITRGKYDDEGWIDSENRFAGGIELEETENL
jgi:hypothetical protein